MDNPRPFDPNPRPSWWKEAAYCDYHQNKGHSTLNCFNLKDKIQDLIDDGELVVDGHNKNTDQKAFKEPFPTYEKGESSNTQTHHKVNYTYTENDNIISMVEPVDEECHNVITLKGKEDNHKPKTPFVLRGPSSYCNVVTIKGQEDNPKPKTPFVLRGPSSNRSQSESSQTCANVVTRSRAKLVIKGPTPSPSAEVEQHKDKALAGPSGKGVKVTTNTTTASYSILD